jgi:hypothetical protein
MRAYRLVLLLSLLAPAAAAQVPDSQPAPDTQKAPEPPAERGARWRTSWFPYLTGGANDGPVLTFRVRHWQPAEYEARTTYTAAFNADAGIAPEGSELYPPRSRRRDCGTAGGSRRRRSSSGRRATGTSAWGTRPPTTRTPTATPSRSRTACGARAPGAWR